MLIIGWLPANLPTLFLNFFFMASRQDSQSHGFLGNTLEWNVSLLSENGNFVGNTLETSSLSTPHHAFLNRRHTKGEQDKGLAKPPRLKPCWVHPLPFPHPQCNKRESFSVKMVQTFCVQQFFSAKNYLQSNHYKNLECNHCFFLFSSFLPPGSFLFSFPFPSLVWFWSLSTQEICLLTPFRPNDGKFRFVCFQKIG